MRHFTMALACLALLQAGPVLADEAEDAVAAASRTDADRALDEGRNPVAVLRFSDFEEGDAVADFMAGGGYYSALIADIVGARGTVYAINPARFHNPETWQQRLSKHHNIRAMPVDPRYMQLAPASVDAIFTHLTFHDIYWESEQFQFPRLDEDQVLANWFAAVKPGGHVIVIDHVGPDGDTRDVVERLHRIAPATIVAAMEKAGFQLVDQSDVLRRSEDDYSLDVFNEAVRGKTDRVVMKFRKSDR